MQNFTLVQFIVFAGAALVGMAALYAAGLAFGLALAGATVLAVLALGVWVIGANILRQRRASGVERRRP